MGSFCNQRQRRYATLYHYVSTVQIRIAHGELSSRHNGFESYTNTKGIHNKFSPEPRSQGTRTVQADSGSDSDSESRHPSPRRLPVGWDRRVEADYRR